MTTEQEYGSHLDNLQDRLQSWSHDDKKVKPPVAVVRSKSDLADRLRLPKPGSRTRGQVPYSLSHQDFESGSTDKIKRRLEDEGDLLNTYWGWHGVVEPEYDMLEPYTVLDVESIMVRALKRKHNLMFRNGFTFTSIRPNLQEYADKRAKQTAFAMRSSFENLLKEILWHLLICSNVFLVKIRNDDASGGVANDKNKQRTPVAGYSLVPAHSMYPYLDGYGRIKFWRRFIGDDRPYRDYDIEDVIHFYWDRKPGHIFGTPRIVPVRDDIFALRRIEENAELLLLSYMFPFTHIKIGTKEAPCQYLPDGTSEVDMYRSYIQNMPKEGVLITDERVEVEIQGGEGKGVDSMPLWDRYKKRVYIGFGVSAVDMGEADEANKSSADNVSQNLKDDAKSDLRWFCEQFKYSVLLDWFEEAPFKVSIQNAVAEVSLEFHELDPDSQIKMESHHLNMFNNHALTHPELRQRIKAKPLADEDNKETHFQRHVMSIEKHRSSTQKELLRMKTNSDMMLTQAQAKADEKVAKTQIKLTQAQGKLEQHKANTHEARAKVVSAGGGAKTSSGKKTTTGRSSRSNPSKTASPKAKVTTNVVQPRNQHGVNLDPHKAKSSAELRLLQDDLMAGLKTLDATDDWSTISRQIIDSVPGVDQELRDTIHSYVARTTDPDLVYVYLRSCLS